MAMLDESSGNKRDENSNEYGALKMNKVNSSSNNNSSASGPVHPPPPRMLRLWLAPSSNNSNTSKTKTSINHKLNHPNLAHPSAFSRNLILNHKFFICELASNQIYI